MRLALLLLAAIAFFRTSAPAYAQVCSDDYVTVETIAGTIVEIVPAPAPFPSADIYIAGPARCPRLWMQVLKKDAQACRAGDRVEAKGVVTSDPAEASWQINPERNEYMLLGADFTCRR